MKKKDHGKILFAVLPLTAFAYYVLRIVSGYNNSEGIVFIGYNTYYPLILLGEFAVITLLFIPFLVKMKEYSRIHTYILPPMLFSALGMMRIDADKMLTSAEADHTPSLMFIILFAVLIIMAFSGYTLTGAAGTLIGTLLFPDFGLCFSPFIPAATFLMKEKNEKLGKISLAVNTSVSVAALIYSVVRLEKTDISFSKAYIPVLLLVTAWTVFCVLKKEYSLLPVGCLPLFPMLGGILFGSFPTALFTLSACISPFAVLLGTSATLGNSEKLKGYTEKLLHNPALYIIIVVFILHTAAFGFFSPGNFRDVYI